MKKVVRLIAVSVLGAAMILGLSACSVDLDLGNGETYTLDLDPILEGLEINLQDVQEYIANVDTEAIANGVKEAIDSVDRAALVDEFEEFIGSIDSEEVAAEVNAALNESLGAIYMGIQSLLNEVAYGIESDGSEQYVQEPVEDLYTEEDIDAVEDENPLFDQLESMTGMSKDEILAAIKEGLEAQDMGAMYDLVVAQLESNPELILEILMQDEDFAALYQADGE